MITDAEAQRRLSQVSATKLNVPRDVAFCGNFPLYLEFTRFYTMCNLIDNPLIISIRETLQTEAESIRLSRATLIDTIASFAPQDAVSIITIDDSGGIESYLNSNASCSTDAGGLEGAEPLQIDVSLSD